MEAYVEATVGAQRVMCGAGNTLDEEFARPHIRRAGARCYYPEGSSRQFAAIAVARDRTAALRSVRCPVAIIHGRQDPLVPLEHGIATHAAIAAGGNANCALHIIDGMGHNLPPHAWTPIAHIVHELAGAQTAHVDAQINE
jgi:pimeloyl-ACP methyl ester carboxylesterase